MKRELENLLSKVDELFSKLDESGSMKPSSYEYMIVFQGVLVQLISSKKLFKRNLDVAEFLNKKFGIVFADYVKKSRPLMIGRTVKYFLSEDDYGDIKEYLNQIYAFIIAVLNGKENELTWSDVIKSMKL